MVKEVFETNPEKAANRIAINSFMMGSLFFIFTIIWTLNPEKFSKILITQIVLAIPLLFVSSLAYSKIAYWKETRLWGALGWFSNNTANIFLLNAVGLMVADIFLILSKYYFGLIIILMLFYSVINVVYNPRCLGQKIFKFLYLVVGLFLGGILPILRGW